MVAAYDEVLTLPGGRRVGYRVRGDADARPILYFHGQPGSRLEADLIPAELLARYGMRVVSFDRPGMGLSDPLPPEDMRLGVEDALRVVDNLGIDRFAVVGVSAGGPPALAISATQPERVRVTVLVSASGPYDDEMYMHESDVEEFRKLRTDGVESFVEAYEADRSAFLADPAASLRAWFAEFPPDELAWLTEPPFGLVAVAEMREALRQGVRGWLREGEVRALPWTFEPAAITAPVRAFHGDCDSLEKLSNLERTLATIPDHVITVYPNGDHFSPWLHADDFVRATTIGFEEARSAT